MPVIKSAIKKLRRDKKKEKTQDVFRLSMEKALKQASKKPTEKTISSAFSILDKAVKKNIIHKNKAARFKSKLAALLPKKTSIKKKETPSSKKTTSKKTAK